MIHRILNKLNFIYSKYVLSFFYKIKYRKYEFICNGSLINCKFNINGNGHRIEFKKGCILRNVQIQINGQNHKLVIGERTQFLNSGRIRMEDKNTSILLGDNIEVSNAFLTTSDNNTQITIGNNCLLSANIIIRSSDGHSIIDTFSGERINMGKDVKIGNNVWVGYGVTILKGSEIEDYSVIGSESVVSGIHVPSHSIIAGVPAKIIRNNIEWKYERIQKN